MPGKENKNFDLTEEASQLGSEDASRMLRRAESDDLYEGQGLGNTPSPDGESAGENRVVTSLSDD